MTREFLDKVDQAGESDCFATQAEGRAIRRVDPTAVPARAGNGGVTPVAFRISRTLRPGAAHEADGAVHTVDRGELTPQNALLTTPCAYAVSTPLIGGGVAEWLKAAVC